jgi:hypothetical protein
MKLFASVLILAALSHALPASSEAQVRVRVNVGVVRHQGRGFGYATPFRYADRYQLNRCRAYSHYGCYPAEVVIVRRPTYRPAPIIVVRPSYRRPYRHR